MWKVMEQGGPIMWPILVVSVITVALVLERLWFLVRIRAQRRPVEVERVLAKAQAGLFADAYADARKSTDPIARVLAEGLAHRDRSLRDAMASAAGRALRPFARGLVFLDTAITLAPLLGLLGTVTGLIRAFGLLGDAQLQAPAALTGGIAEALIATAFGLIVAIIALIPFNLLNSNLEKVRGEMEEAATRLELSLARLPSNDGNPGTES